MEKQKNETKQKGELSKKILMERYSEYLLSEGEPPKNVYTFAKNLGYVEADFYQYFSGFDSLEEEFLVFFFDQSRELMEKMKDYKELSSEEKLLNFYYIFFENLNMNRSLVLLLLGINLKSKFEKLRYLRKSHRQYIKTLDFENWGIIEKLPEKLKSRSDKSKEEALWIHFLSILNFWKNDRSPGFEKTDVYIEKTIDTGFVLAQSPLVDKFMDLGKFIWKEKFQ